MRYWGTGQERAPRKANSTEQQNQTPQYQKGALRSCRLLPELWGTALCILKKNKIRVNISVVNIKMLTNDRLLFKQDAKNQNWGFDHITFGSQSLKCSLGRRFYPKNSLITGCLVSKPSWVGHPQRQADKKHHLYWQKTNCSKTQHHSVWAKQCLGWCCSSCCRGGEAGCSQPCGHSRFAVCLSKGDTTSTFTGF